MKAASLNEIKNALATLSQKEITELCLRLAKYRKENKELLTYLIFEADDPKLFIKHVKEEMDLMFSQMARSNVYLAKKTLRKVLSATNKYIKFSGSKEVEIELLLYFCQTMKGSGLRFHDYPVTENIYNRQIAKIRKAINTLHEDLQYDYGFELEKLGQA
jgi:hypothetical protein